MPPAPHPFVFIMFGITGLFAGWTFSSPSFSLAVYFGLLSLWLIKTEAK